ASDRCGGGRRLLAAVRAQEPPSASWLAPLVRLAPLPDDRRLLDGEPDGRPRLGRLSDPRPDPPVRAGKVNFEAAAEVRDPVRATAERTVVMDAHVLRPNHDDDIGGSGEAGIHSGQRPERGLDLAVATLAREQRASAEEGSDERGPG